MNRLRRPRVAVVGITIALAVVAVACSGGPPAAPTRAAVGKPVHYVALGGDDVYGGRRRLTASWTQALFRDHLPVNATFVNLASPHNGSDEIRRDQVPTAIRLRPDIVTITLIDDLERATPPEDVQRDLSAIISSLRKVDGIRILVGTAPLDTDIEKVRSAYNAAVTAAVRTGGAELVDLSQVSATDTKLRAEQIADAFARELAKQ
jgi:GDSL-like Lipase/Acylhydrolase family